MSAEIWRTIPGIPDCYEVSDLGRVRSFKSGSPRILSGGVDTRGYRQVTLMTNGGQRSKLVHRLVALAFLGAPPNYAKGRAEVCHGDGDRQNNHLSNLRWGSSADNSADAIAHGTHVVVEQRSRTHCPYGHDYDDANTGYSTTGKGHLTRSCRKCSARRQRERYARLKASR